MRHKIRVIISLAALFAITGCADDIDFNLNNANTGGFTPKGTPVEAYLDLTVGELAVNVGTRASDDPVEDTEAERRVDNIWLFQYDKATGNLIAAPNYYTVTDQAMLTNFPAELSDNDGEPCIVYVVTNTGDDSWAAKATNSGSGFETIEQLKTHTIPDPSPIRVEYDGTDSDVDTQSISIPMSGSAGEDDEEVVISEGAEITVYVRRMYARLVMTVNLTPFEGYPTTLYSLTVDNISNSCTVETNYNSDQSWYTPEGTAFEVSRSFVTGLEPTDDGDEQTEYGTFILYVPENIQGETLNAYALKLSPTLRLRDSSEGVNYTVNAYKAYPGSWTDEIDVGSNEEEGTGENYNICRNTTYNITLNIDITFPIVTPSANSIIIKPGTVGSFYPYVRDEVPSEELEAEMANNSDLATIYNFTTYLNSSYTEGDQNKKIKGVKIVWQTDGCIGDNTNGDKVWIDNAPDDDLSDADKSSAEYMRRIYVSAANPGNALVAAYDDEACEGNILWSWHIWVTDIEPESTAIEYYTYSWDSTNGIDASNSIPGRLVMNCNLGALAYKPAEEGVEDFDTYGMLYQWGRKDPFLPMKGTTDYLATTGQKYGNVVYNYADYSYTCSTSQGNDRAATIYVTIGAHDNANESVPMTGNDGSLNSKGQYLFDTDSPGNLSSGGFGSDNATIILNSVRHPTTFIAAETARSSSNVATASAFSNQGDWLVTNDDFLWGGGHPGNGEYRVYSSDTSSDKYNSVYPVDAFLEDDYGPEKTIFDPCPYGWRVSPGDIWLGFTVNGTNKWCTEGWDFYETINCADKDQSTACRQNGFTFYMQGWKGSKGSATSFFPTQGSRLASGQPYNKVGVCGNYHNATVDEACTSGNYTFRRVDILHLHMLDDGETWGMKQFESDVYYYVKAVAGPVRCVRDTK